MTVGLWEIRSRIWLTQRKSSSTLQRLRMWSRLPCQNMARIGNFCSFECSRLYFSSIVQTFYYMSNLVISLMHYTCLFWSNYFVFTMCKLFSYFSDANSRLIILSLLREDDENDTTTFTVCFWTNPTDEAHALFQILNTGVIRKIVPRQPLEPKK